MLYVTKVLLSTVAALGMTVALPVMAQEDSASQAAAGFVSVLPASTGLVIRVPVNIAGEENTNAAEMKLWESPTLPADGTAVANAYSGLRDAGGAGPQIDPVRATADSSTFGWRHGWNHYGWQRPYYYTHYQPVFYYHTFSYPYYYNFHHTYLYPSWGYRYYFYRPYW